MLMPKTAVYKDCFSEHWQNYIRRSGELLDVQLKFKTSRAEKTSHEKFGPGVSVSYPAHYPAPFGSRKNVGHEHHCPNYHIRFVFVRPFCTCLCKKFKASGCKLASEV
jgi:hypothetical protein